MKKYRWDKKYLYWGVTAFAVIVCSIAFFWVLQRWTNVRDALKLAADILAPFIWGMIIAYLLTPLARILEQRVFTPLGKRLYKKPAGREMKIHNFARAMSIGVSLLFGIIIITALLWLVLPQLSRSIGNVLVTTQEYVPKGIEWVEKLLIDYPDVERFVTSLIGNISEAINNWIKNTVMPWITGAVTILSTSVLSVVSGIFDLVIGMIISCYISFNKERFGAHLKKVAYSTLPDVWVRRIFGAVSSFDRAFTAFISGKILDSLIIGLLCYIFCMIAGMPYAILVSVLIGVTNIIPFFGPFIGGIPATFIILMVSPVKGLIFGIFVVLLQQFDGNILGPKILGETTGLNGFWVLFAILIGQGLFGLPGMICGVPIFSVIYTAIRNIVNSRLEERGLPVSTAVYMNLDHLHEQTHEPIKKAPAEKGRGSWNVVIGSKSDKAKAQDKDDDEDSPSGTD